LEILLKRRDFIRTGLLAAPALQLAAKDTWAETLGAAAQSPLQIDVSAATAGTPLDHYWSRCVAAGRANEGLRGNWQEQLKSVVDQCGFRYLRFHGLFHDDMFVYNEKNGQPVYNWQYVDDLYDRMLARGIRPFVEMTFFPKDIAKDPGGLCWWNAHSTPPADFTRWKEVIEHFVRHCIARYGLNEVRSWYFEIWNEPNLDGFWRGTQQQFFEMYKVIALAIKAIDPQLRIGGPSTSSFHPDEAEYQRLKSKKDITAADFIGVESKAPWMEEFLAYCESENLPLDFVSSHPYPTSYPIDSAGDQLEVSRPVTSTREDILWLRKAMAKTRYKNAEIHLTEWSSSPSIQDHTRDYPQEATFIVKVNLDCIGLAQSLTYWTFTDIFEEAGGADTVFNGGFGLVNFQGIVKPGFHAYRMLHGLGDTELHREEGCIVTRHSQSGQVSALLYNYPAEVISAVPLAKTSREIAEKTLATGHQRDVDLRLPGLTPGAAFVVETLDAHHGFSFRSWQEMGSPEPPTREQEALLRQKAMATGREQIRVGSDGVLRWTHRIEPWAVVAIYPA
jgi:xylan 1,4-beta-xylosidase